MPAQCKNNLGTPEPDAENHSKRFPLFGRSQVTEEEATREFVELFAARVSKFEASMQSQWEHLSLKADLVAHINANH